MVDVCATTPRAGNCVGGLLRIKSTIDLRKTGPLHVELELVRKQSGVFGLPNVPSFGN